MLSKKILSAAMLTAVMGVGMPMMSATPALAQTTAPKPAPAAKTKHDVPVQPGDKYVWSYWTSEEGYIVKIEYKRLSDGKTLTQDINPYDTNDTSKDPLSKKVLDEFIYPKMEKVRVGNAENNKNNPYPEIGILKNMDRNDPNMIMDIFDKMPRQSADIIIDKYEGAPINCHIDTTQYGSSGGGGGFAPDAKTTPNVNAVSNDQCGYAESQYEKTDAQKPLSGVEFKISKIENWDIKNVADWYSYLSIMRNDQVDVSDLKLSDATRVKTGEDGKAVAKSLPYAFYLVEEVSDGKHTVSEPRIVSLPGLHDNDILNDLSNMFTMNGGIVRSATTTDSPINFYNARVKSAIDNNGTMPKFNESVIFHNVQAEYPWQYDNQNYNDYRMMPFCNGYGEFPMPGGGGSSGGYGDGSGGSSGGGGYHQFAPDTMILAGGGSSGGGGGYSGGSSGGGSTGYEGGSEGMTNYYGDTTDPGCKPFAAKTNFNLESTSSITIPPSGGNTSSDPNRIRGVSNLERRIFFASLNKNEYKKYDMVNYNNGSTKSWINSIDTLGNTYVPFRNETIGISKKVIDKGDNLGDTLTYELISGTQSPESMINATGRIDISSNEGGGNGGWSSGGFAPDVDKPNVNNNPDFDPSKVKTNYYSSIVIPNETPGETRSKRIQDAIKEMREEMYANSNVPGNYVAFDQYVIEDDYDETQVKPDLNTVKLSYVKKDGSVIQGIDSTMYKSEDKDGRIRIAFTNDGLDEMLKLRVQHGEELKVKTTFDAKITDVKYADAKDMEGEIINGAVLLTPNAHTGYASNTVVTKEGRLQAIKVDSKDKPLAGAEFSLHRCETGKNTLLPVDEKLTINGKSTFISDATGLVNIESVQNPSFYDGKEQTQAFDYCLIEDKAPEGYIKVDAPILVKYGNGLEQVKVVNEGEPVVEEPTPTPTPTPEPSEEPTPAPTPTPEPSEEPTPTPTSEVTTSNTPTPTPTPEVTTSKSQTPTPAPTTSKESTPAPTYAKSTTTAPAPVKSEVPAPPTKKNPQVNTGGHAEKVSVLDRIMSIFR